MNTKSDWSWKDPADKGKSPPDYKKKKRKNKKARQHERDSSKPANPSFYKSDKWRSLRYRVLRKYSGECMCCGMSKKRHNVVIHVDHIKPKSTHPELALQFENLQLLCEDCNLGKSNQDETDWRPEVLSDVDRLIMRAAIKHL